MFFLASKILWIVTAPVNVALVAALGFAELPYKSIKPS